MSNIVKIYHQDGLCEFPVKDIDFSIGEKKFDLEISTSAGTGPLAGLGEPHFGIDDATISVSSIDDLTVEALTEVQGWDTLETSKADNIFRVYFGEHLGVDNNEVSLTKNDDGTLTILWKGDAPDFNYYDERAKRNKIEVLVTFEP